MSYGMQGPLGKTGNKLPHGTGVGQIQQFDPQQMKLYGERYAHVDPESFTARLAAGDEEMFREIEAPALKQFGSFQGNLASRFSGMGQGARRSSGFQNTSNQAASDFAMQLQSQRMGLQRQATQDLAAMSNEILGYRPYETFTYQKEKKPGWGAYAGAGIGALAGFAMGGPMGAMQGASMGYGIGGGIGGDGGGGGGGASNFGSIFNTETPIGKFAANAQQAWGNKGLMNQAQGTVG